LRKQATWKRSGVVNPNKTLLATVAAAQMLRDLIESMYAELSAVPSRLAHLASS
jgi:hypothetical protein